MFSNILIIDKRKELSVKYKKSLEGEQITVNISRDLKDAIMLIQNNEPDVIIVSESIGEALDSICNKIRVLTYDTRPVIVALSKSAELEDKIRVLESGADDYISEPVNTEEFKIRIKAHLRRDIESNLDDVTLLPDKKYVRKVLKRILNSGNKPAVLLAGMENFNDYKRKYSEIASNKLVQTFVAIMKSALNDVDFIGQLDETNFVIVTNPYSAEKIAAFLTFAFDTVISKFYSQSDAKRGYMLLKSDGTAGMRGNFVSVLIGGIIDNYEMIKTPKELLTRLMSIKKTAKIPSGSNYAIDRVKITGDNSVVSSEVNQEIYIKEPDEALAILLRTTLELQGYNVSENFDINSVQPPAVMIIDSGEDGAGLELCSDLKKNTNFVNTKIIVTTSIHDKTSVLNAGADLYLPKPYEVTDLIRWIAYFMRNLEY